MIFEVNFNPAYLRWILLGARGVLLVLSWVTDDMIWASRYRKEAYTGHKYEIEPNEMEGGWNRLLALLVGIGLLAAGAAWP